MRTIFAGAVLAAVCAANNSKTHTDLTVVDLTQREVYQTQDYWNPDSHAYERRTQDRRDRHASQAWDSAPVSRSQKNVQAEPTPVQDFVEKKSKQVIVNSVKRKLQANADATPPPEVATVVDGPNGVQADDPVIAVDPPLPDVLLGGDSDDEGDVLLGEDSADEGGELTTVDISDQAD